MRRSIAILILFFVLHWLGCADSDPSRVVTEPQNEIPSVSRQVQVRWSNPDGTRESLELIQSPTQFSLNPAVFTEEYLRTLYRGDYDSRLHFVEPRIVVLHSMALGTLERGLRESDFFAAEAQGTLRRYGRMPPGAHFIVDRDGTVFVLAPPRNAVGQVDYSGAGRFPTMRHLIEANPWSIGIENIAPWLPDWYSAPVSENEQVFGDLTSEQVNANAALIRWLASRSFEIGYVFSHDQFVSSSFREQAFGQNIVPLRGLDSYRTSHRFDTGGAFRHRVLESVNRSGFLLEEFPGAIARP